MTETLKPCPFCGGIAKPRVNLANAQPVMRCRRCGSWTYFDETEKMKDGEKAADAIIKAWNRGGSNCRRRRKNERF